MPIDDSLNALIATHAPATAASLMDTQNVASQIALRNAQIPLQAEALKTNQLENEQRQMVIDDERAMRDWMKDPANVYSFGKGDFTGLAGKVSPNTLLKLQQNMTEAQKAHAQLGIEQLSLHDKTLGELQNGFDGLLQMGTDAQRAEAWPALVQQWRSLGYLNGVNVPATITGNKDELMQIATPLQLAKGLNEAALDRAKTQAETSQKNAAAKRDTADAAMTQMELDAAKMTPDQAAARVGIVVDPNKFPGVYKTALGEYLSAVKLSEKQKVLDKYGSMIAELDPDVQKARTRQAVNTAVGTEVAKARLSGGALANVFDPSLRNKSETQMIADSNELANTISDADRFQRTVDLAQSGNQNAPGMLGPEEMRQVLNRVNAVELNAIGKGAGSAYQRLQGWIGGWTSGQPIPPQILQDMKEVSRTFQAAAKLRFKNKVAMNNETTGSTWDSKSYENIVAPKPAGTITVRAGDNSTHDFASEEEAQRFEQAVKQAGGSSQRVQ